jgi:ATP-dependent RNA helicase RhlE
MPNIPETYVHRIGRTGRAGNTGIAISFTSTEEREELRVIQKLLGKTIPVIHEHPFVSNAMMAAPVVVQRQQQSFKPKRSFNGQQRQGGNNFRNSRSTQRAR